MAGILSGVLFVGVLVVLGEGFGYVRAVVALLMFVAIALFGTRYMHFLLNAPPDP